MKSQKNQVGVLSTPQLNPTHHGPRNPVMPEGSFWSQIFQALSTALYQFVHLASRGTGQGTESISPHLGQKWLKCLGDMDSFYYGIWYVSDVDSWDLLSFWMSNSILSLSDEWGGWFIIVGNPGIVTLGIFFCSSKPRTLTTKQPLAGNYTLYLYVHNIACIRLIYEFEFM